MKKWKKTSYLKRAVAAVLAMTVACSYSVIPTETVKAQTKNIEDTMTFGTMGISGGGFVSGIVTGKKVMYARTDVGGAYKYNYETNEIYRCYYIYTCIKYWEPIELTIYERWVWWKTKKESIRRIGLVEFIKEHYKEMYLKWMNEDEFISFINSDGMIPFQTERYHDYFV